MRKVIDIDQVEEPVRRFLERLEPSEEASVVHVAGHDVFLVVRPGAKKGKRPGRWTSAKNKRRVVLIRKDIAGTITPEEVIELADLTGQMRAHVNKVAPRVTPELEQFYEAVVGSPAPRTEL